MSQPPQAPPTASREFRDFINCCLQRDPSQRWPAGKLLNHPFITHNTTTPGAAAAVNSSNQVHQPHCSLPTPLHQGSPPTPPPPFLILLFGELMVSLKLQKRLAASVLKYGRGTIWLDPNEVNEISMANSRQPIRKLVKDGFVIRNPTKLHSRSRARRMNDADSRPVVVFSTMRAMFL
ncbi:hypothetical protein TEA_020639 [Camellia sinensis var. sinensis]|uniref:Large ribosomal subunit protein eL19 domain-containing protein n=1 Tax=Camellia sinensis var. sinensis TaxID=542762 RepID=A0A4S4D2G4_CAMSN|nr:hypothetical protein TEA_020639 [Camellia sinensis var. sinensis]